MIDSTSTRCSFRFEESGYTCGVPSIIDPNPGMPMNSRERTIALRIEVSTVGRHFAAARRPAVKTSADVNRGVTE